MPVFWSRPPPDPDVEFVPPNRGGKELPVKLATEPLVGYRTWLVWHGLTGFGLASIHVNYEWVAGVNEARCVSSGSGRVHHGDPAPSPSCTCGFYCNLPDMPFAEWDHLIGPRVHATGQVAMSGRIIRCEKGFKAGRVEMLSPILIEAGCHIRQGGPCTNGVTGIVLPEGSGITFRAVCEEHRPILAPRLIVVDASVWMRELRRALEVKYPGIEFVSFIE